MNMQQHRLPIRQSGFSLIEMMVGLVAAALVLAGTYTLWSTHQREGYRLEKKIDLRNQITLSSKKIQRSITLAGIGLNGAANLEKADATGSDTLIIYTNMAEARSNLSSNISKTVPAISVTNPAAFSGASYVAVGSGPSGEIRHIDHQSGSMLYLDAPFSSDHPMATTIAYPAMRERYYTDQAANHLMRESGGTAVAVAADIRNFQVSFKDKSGASTEIQSEVRTVQYSFTGVFPAPEGALTSMVFSSTAIPRNIL